MFQTLLNKYEFKRNLNRPDHCTYIAFVELFYHSLKYKLIRGNVCKCVDDLRSALNMHINQFYNAVRLHPQT